MKLGIISVLAVAIVTSGCDRLSNVGKPPAFSPVTDAADRSVAGVSPARAALASPPPADFRQGSARSSLWNAGPASLLGDRRAQRRGDILTVLIEIDDQANISNSSNRARSGSESLGINSLVGIPQILENKLPGDASFGDLADVNSSSSSSGNGSVQRNEQIALKIAATVVDVLPNGHLVVQGTQEVRVNFELRDLQVAGIVRPEDISRQNTITYDKIAGARVSYGGRGHISDVQQPRYGQQVTDIILPF